MRTVARRWTLALGLSLLATAALGQEDAPEVVRIKIEAGDRHRDAGRFDEAIASYREAIRLGPSVVDVYVSLGALYHARGELDRSLEVFLEGLEIDARHRDLLYDAAVVALALNRAEEARGYASRGLDTDRRDVELLMVESTALTRLDRIEEALAALETAAGARSGDPRILYRLGNLYHQLERREEAIEAYRKAVKKDRGMVRAYYNLGAVLFEVERFDEALRAYRVALEPLEKAIDSGGDVDPIHARAFLNLGAIHSRRLEWRQALEAYQRAVRLAPENPGGHYNRGYALVAMDRFEDAATAYQRALALDPELPLAYLHLGQIARRRGVYEEAVRWLEEGMPRFTESSRLTALRALVECRRELGDADGVEAAYRGILELRPDDAPTLLALGRDLRRQDRRDEARRLLEQARGLLPEDAGVALELASLARSEGDVATEGRLYQEVLERPGAGPELLPVRLNLALLLLRQGDAAAARGHFDELARASSGRSGNNAGNLPAEQRRLVATLRGLLLAVEGDLRGARRQLSTVSEFDAAAAVVAVLDTIEGQPGKAVAALQTSYERAKDGPIGPLARANLGLALWSAGRGDQARQHLAAAVAAFPEQPGPRAALGDIELRQGRHELAAEHLTAAAEHCGDGGGTPALPASVFEVTIGASDELCAWIERGLGIALVGGAVDEFASAVAGRGSTAALRARLDRALDLPLRPADRALALYLRGTLTLAAGSLCSARQDLAAALEGGLADRLAPLARNNLGVAWARLGNAGEARRVLAAARSAEAPEAALNLGILADDHGGDPQQALDFYSEYLKTAGPRRQEVASWVERLRKIYR
ncbi:MAG: tetratricopeptide repeat protein [Thermoanaerobaculia bacterium]